MKKMMLIAAVAAAGAAVAAGLDVREPGIRFIIR